MRMRFYRTNVFYLVIFHILDLHLDPHLLTLAINSAFLPPYVLETGKDNRVRVAFIKAFLLISQLHTTLNPVSFHLLLQSPHFNTPNTIYKTLTI